MVDIPCVPHVFVHQGLRGDYSAAVDDRPYGEYKLYAILTGYTGALLHLRVRRVGHDSAEIGYLLSTLFKP